MLATTLGLDLSTPSGLFTLALATSMVCLIVGFLADAILGKAGFGIFGNGFIVVFGVAVTAYVLDHQSVGIGTIDSLGGLTLAAACGTALLLMMAAVKQRID